MFHIGCSNKSYLLFKYSVLGVQFQPKYAENFYYKVKADLKITIDIFTVFPTSGTFINKTIQKITFLYETENGYLIIVTATDGSIYRIENFIFTGNLIFTLGTTGRTVKMILPPNSIVPNEIYRYRPPGMPTDILAIY